METFHTGGQQRQRAEVSDKSPLLHDPYPAMDRCGHLSERILRHVPSTGYSHLCDLDADRIRLPWIYFLHFKKPQKIKRTDTGRF